MMLGTSRILELLRERPGRYIEHSIGCYRMKEMNCGDVTVTGSGRRFSIKPLAQQMDDLMDASHLTHDGSRYSVSGSFLIEALTGFYIVPDPCWVDCSVRSRGATTCPLVRFQG